jgi:hypothetical protein
MNAWIRRLAATALLLLPLLLLTECRKEASPAMCGVSDDGSAIDVAGRGDGLYGMIDGRVGEAPLARFERITRTGGGVGPEGKKWVGVHLDGDEARAVEAFTANPEGRRLVGVMGGAVVFQHKVRAALTSGDAQVSCCNPAYCERWEGILQRR